MQSVLEIPGLACPLLVQNRVGGMTRISKECSGLASLDGGQEGSWKG